MLFGYISWIHHNYITGVDNSWITDLWSKYHNAQSSVMAYQILYGTERNDNIPFIVTTVVYL